MLFRSRTAGRYGGPASGGGRVVAEGGAGLGLAGRRGRPEVGPRAGHGHLGRQVALAVGVVAADRDGRRARLALEVERGLLALVGLAVTLDGALDGDLVAGLGRLRRGVRGDGDRRPVVVELVVADDGVLEGRVEGGVRSVVRLGQTDLDVAVLEPRALGVRGEDDVGGVLDRKSVV